MSSLVDHFISEAQARIAAYAEARRISVTTFGRHAVNDTSLVRKIGEGRVTVRIIRNALAYIEANPVESAPRSTGRSPSSRHPATARTPDPANSVSKEGSHAG